jgi:hypothetical protein
LFTAVADVSSAHERDTICAADDAFADEMSAIPVAAGILRNGSAQKSIGGASVVHYLRPNKPLAT